MPPELDCEILVVGAGISGIGAGIALRERGFTDFVILEKAGEVGGTWRDHTYPGLTVDVPSLIYSFSFAPKADWSSLWATQQELLDYLRGCADRFGVREHVRFGSEVLDAAWNADDHCWVTRVADGRTYRSRYLINGSGYLSTPRWPDIDGLEEFAGTKIHTSQWSSDLDFAGKRVGFIGTGATAIQLAPQIAQNAKQLHLFQRTPIWLLPKPGLRISPRLAWGFSRIPGLQRACRLALMSFMDLVFFRVFVNYRQVAGFGRLAERTARRHISSQVEDPALQKALTPDYSWGCKRPSFSNDYYPMFNRPNVELVTSGIQKVTPEAIVDIDGVERQVDALVCATGYQPFERHSLPTYPVYGVDGIELQEYWDRNRYQAFLGLAVTGYPNFFLVFGPYSPVSSSYYGMVELAMHNIIHCISASKARGTDYVEVTANAQAREHRTILRRKKRSIWSVADCGTSNTFYLDRFGDTPGFRPNYHPWEWLTSRLLRMRHFHFRPKSDR